MLLRWISLVPTQVSFWSPPLHTAPFPRYQTLRNESPKASGFPQQTPCCLPVSAGQELRKVSLGCSGIGCVVGLQSGGGWSSWGLAGTPTPQPSAELYQSKRSQEANPLSGGGRVDPISQWEHVRGAPDSKQSQPPALLSNNSHRHMGLRYLDVTLLGSNPFIYQTYFYFLELRCRDLSELYPSIHCTFVSIDSCSGSHSFIHSFLSPYAYSHFLPHLP